eukprot:264248_1
MLYKRGHTGHHEYGVLSTIPDHISRKKHIYCQGFIHKYRELICAIFTLIVLIILHWNFNSYSTFDELHLFTCSSSNNHICSLIYGCFETILFAAILIALYYGFFYLYFRLRYHLSSTDLLSGIDAYIISLPWLLSPLLKWHSVTSLIMHSSQLFDSLFFYQYPQHISAEIASISTTSTRTLLEINIQNDILSDNNMQINTTNAIYIEDIGYELPVYSLLVAAFIRTLWSFLLWNGLDHYLWTHKSLTWLFESGPNKAIISLKAEHQRIVYNTLLPYFDYISDITRLCVQFIDDQPLILLDIKKSIFQSLKHNNLSTSYKWFSVITAVMSGYRLWYCPSVGYIFAPVFFIIGVIVIVLIVILAILEGDPGSFNCDFRLCNYHFFIVFGVFGAGICWGFIIWWCMQKRLKILKNIQENTYSNNSFEYRLARTVYDL